MKQIIKVGDLNNELVNASKIVHIEKNVYRIESENGNHVIEVLEFNSITKELKIRHNHNTHELTFKKPVDEMLDQLGIKPAAATANKDIKAPMPGKVLQIMVNVGDVVEKGSPILVLEAMKMENVLKAEIDGKVKKIIAIQDKNVEKNQILVEMDLV